MTLNCNRLVMMLLLAAILFITACDSNNRTTTKAVQSPQLSASLSKEKYKAGERKVITINGVEFAFRWCPAGTFMMGVPVSEKEQDNNAKRHTVTLTQGFWIMETEVTQKQWKAIMGTLPECGFKGDDLPIENVSWNDCQEFCKKCNQLDLSVQLPTEAQWEYACRAGCLEPDTGDLDDYAWYGLRSDKQTHPVGTKAPNEWGIYDMIGNVWEWCADRYGEYPDGNVKNPKGSLNGSDRVFRGGAWDDYSWICRSTFRKYSEPDNQLDSLGFRCVMASDSEESADKTGNSSEIKAGDRAVKYINGVEFAFRYCPAGIFMMGSPSSEKGHNADEKRHQVTLSKGFWIMETEVTQKQWNVIMKKNRSYNKGDDLPVEIVSWNDCQEFCKNCEQLDLPVQLPTEAQWEYACRAGSTTPYFWGDFLDGVQANCDGHYGHELFGKKGKKVGNTTPVGSYPPNEWGLYDTHGNVLEWCADRFAPYSGKSETDPTGPSTGSVRVTRGGFFDAPPDFCRSARRHCANEKARSLYIGFRCALNE